MKYTENALNILTTKSYKGIGNAWIIKNLKGNEEVSEIVSLLNHKIKEKTNIDEFINLRSRFEETLNKKLENFCDGFVALGDNNFPQYRGTVKDSERPIFLYYKGDLDLLNIDNNNVSVIGLLSPDSEIEERERNIVSEFVKNGATIVSGLALGCDSISHKETLVRNGKTVAILPSPLYDIMPATNKGLAFQIVDEGGLLITEYGTDFKSKMELSSRYKERDRLQALFCEIIVLASSYAQNSAERWNLYGQKLDSGARLAMGFAKDYGIPRAIMYDKEIDENNPMFDLNRDLINENGNITVIEQSRISETVNNIMHRFSETKNRNIVQGNLFH